MNTPLKEYQHRIALFARLANIASLTELPPQKKRALVREAERAGITTKAFSSVMGKPAPISAEAQQAWHQDTPAPLAWSVLFAVHASVKQLHSLFDGNTLVMPTFQPPAAYQLYTLRKGALASALGVPVTVHRQWSRDGHTALWDRRDPHEELLAAFRASLKEYPVPPYKQCPECKTIFVAEAKRGKPRVYCSLRCTRQAAEARRDREARNRYQRKLMKARRSTR